MKLYGILAITALVTILITSCKTTEKNYRSTMNRFDIVTYKADSNNVYTL